MSPCFPTPIPRALAEGFQNIQARSSLYSALTLWVGRGPSCPISHHAVPTMGYRTTCRSLLLLFILTTSLGGRLYYPAHFTGEDTEAQDGVPQAAARVHSSVVLSRGGSAPSEWA